MKYLFFVILSLVLNNTLHAKELIISEIKNKIETVNIYGNKFILNKNYIIKNGDFVKSKNQNSYFVFNNVKICLAKNSSVKFKEIKSKNIIGCQFHPEKSGQNGLNFLKKIIKLYE